MTVKSPWFAPVMDGAPRVNVAALLLERVMDCAELVTLSVKVPKLSELGAREAVAPLPVPVSAAEREPPVKFAVTDPLRAPVAEGVKVTEKPQAAPAASVGPQLLLMTAKSPLAEMLMAAMEKLLLLFSVTPQAALVEFTVCEPKLMVLGAK